MPLSFRSIAIQIGLFHEYLYLVVGVLAILLTLSNKRFRWLWIFLISSGIAHLVTIILASRGINNIPFYHLIGLLEISLVFLLYLEIGIAKRWKYAVGVLLVYYLINSIVFSSIWEISGLSLALVQLCIFGFGTNFLYNLYNDPNPKPLQQRPFFLMNAGFMLYAAGSFLSLAVNERLIANMSDELFDSSWLIEAGFGILRLILIVFGLIIYRIGR